MHSKPSSQLLSFVSPSKEILRCQSLQVEQKIKYVVQEVDERVAGKFHQRWNTKARTTIIMIIKKVKDINKIYRNVKKLCSIFLHAIVSNFVDQSYNVRLLDTDLKYLHILKHIFGLYWCEFVTHHNLDIRSIGEMSISRPTNFLYLT